MESKSYRIQCKNCPYEWDRVVCGEIQIDEVINLFFVNRKTLDCVTFKDSKCTLSTEVLGDFWVDAILKTEVSNILNLIERSEAMREKIAPANISQFSKFDEVDNVIRILADSGLEYIDWKTIGYFLEGKAKKEGARQKYGENHYKLAVQLGLASSMNNFEISVLGEAYRRLTDDRSKKEIKSKLILRVPIIQEVLIKSKIENVNLTEEMSKYLAQSTVERRRSNIKQLLQLLTFLNSAELNTRIGCIS